MPSVSVQPHNAKGSLSAQINHDPDECPICHRSMSLTAVLYVQTNNAVLQGIYQCASLACHRLFISTFQQTSSGAYNFHHSAPHAVIKREIDDSIKSISPDFCTAYQQSWTAKQNGMDMIAGAGFRRALEFLVKDYAVRNKPENENEEILKRPLVQCIKDEIHEDGIKTVAERAAWLGNDESHYLRKWQDKDVNDLIELIDSVAAWIVIHLKTERLKHDMPAR